jgi:hypothetical protein
MMFQAEDYLSFSSKMGSASWRGMVLKRVGGVGRYKVVWGAERCVQV